MDFQEIIARARGKGAGSAPWSLTREGRPADLLPCVHRRSGWEDACLRGERVRSSDRLNSFGGYGVVRIPGLQKLLHYICRNGYEHHVAVNIGHYGAAVARRLHIKVGKCTSMRARNTRARIRDIITGHEASIADFSSARRGHCSRCWLPRLSSMRVSRASSMNSANPAFNGQTFGKAGPYETLPGAFFGEIDPKDRRNVIITDIPIRTQERARNGWNTPERSQFRNRRTCRNPTTFCSTAS